MNNRNFELDILRGVTVALMITLDPPPDAIYKILQHAAWEGMTLTDLVFPAFVFAMGASAAFATARRPPSPVKIFRRAGLLFLIGLLLNVLIYFRLEQEYLRIFGVLQRLALTYFFGMLILLKIKSAAKISIVAFLLLIISSTGFHIYAPDAPFVEVRNISGSIDKIFPGVNHIYTPTHDPEGLYGILASTASMLFGILAGKFLLKNERWQMILYGLSILILGYGWSFFDVISKKLWTSPFALLNAGGDMILLVTLGILFERLPRIKKFFNPFESLGKNPLFFFVASNVALIFLFSIKIGEVAAWTWFYQNTLQGVFSVEFSTTIFCVTWCLLWMIPAEFLNRRGLFIRI